MSGQDQVLSLLDGLCRIESYNPGPGEEAMAHRVAAEIRTHCPWLTVREREVEEGIWNVFAFNGPVEEIKLLVTGHIDTVSPASDNTVEAHAVRDGKYYARGAADTKSGIAACLDAMRIAGETRNVAFLFYGDEESDFKGMLAFLDEMSGTGFRPAYCLSLCGGYGKSMIACRGCIEMEVTVKGKSGHASRQTEGANAIDALRAVIAAIHAAAQHALAEYPTTVNVAAVHAGFGLPDTEPRKPRVAPPVENRANKIPDVAWTVVDMRPGGPEFNEGVVRAAVEAAIARHNEGLPHPVTCEIRTNFALSGYATPRHEAEPILAAFDPVTGGGILPPTDYGFIDVALLAARYETRCVCLSPFGGPAHGPDEQVEIASMVAYRDCMVELLTGYKAG